MRAITSVLLALPLTYGYPTRGSGDSLTPKHEEYHHVNDANLHERVKHLASLVATHTKAPTHLKTHAQHICMLHARSSPARTTVRSQPLRCDADAPCTAASTASLSEVHKLQDHSANTMDLVMGALSTQSTEEQESTGTWLTQCELDRIANVPCHHDDRMPKETSHSSAAISLIQLEFADIDSAPAKWDAIGRVIPYCFLTDGPHRIELESTKQAMRFAFEVPTLRLQHGIPPRDPSRYPHCGSNAGRSDPLLNPSCDRSLRVTRPPSSRSTCSTAPTTA